MSGRDIAVAGALVVACANGLAAVFGAWCWHRDAHNREFWLGVRAAQALAVAYAVIVGVLILTHNRPGSGLFYLYALLPVAIGFLAEQLRISAADAVLTSRGIEQTSEVAALPAAEQRAIVLAIMRREIGVMALAALVVCVLALRAAGTY